MNPRRKILFLCTGNSCRSQMAEGWARHLKGDAVEAYSAGIETHGLNPHAVAVMAEAGVDISGHRSKTVAKFADVEFDYVVTVCGHAHETCPFFPGRAKVVHVGFDDPPKLAAAVADPEEKMDCYRRVRDEIRAFVETLPESLEPNRRNRMPDLAHPPSNIRPSPGGTAHFDQAAITWEDNPVRRQLNDAVTAAITEAIPLHPGWTVLEYGCGTAALSRRLAPQVSNVLAVDASAGMIAEAAKFATAQGLANLATRQLDLLCDPPPAERFDLIVSAMTLHHVADTSLLFHRLRALLRPGGQMALADLFPEDGSFHGDPEIPHHGFDPASLADILTGLGLANAAWREIHRIEKNGRAYPVFLLTAHG